MDRCDVLIVGGGPAGSSCAWALRKAGLDVVVMDKATFPRDKVCAGWITPGVIAALELDTDDYRQRHVFQPISGFRVGRPNGLSGGFLGGPMLEIRYAQTVSYGIRRCEFDAYLLQRSDARLRLGEPLETLTRIPDGWLINGTLQTPMLVGAGGHFCPVARFLGADVGQGELAVHAQECEYAIDAADLPAYRVESGMPELYFCADLKGYGWCVRKGDFINIGLGREDKHGLAQQVDDFRRFLVATGRVPADIMPRFKGHAYLLYRHARRNPIDEGVLLIGDAAGLAYTESGEGIRPAIESGLLAATTILQAERRYTRTALEPYVRRLTARFGARDSRDWSSLLPPNIKSKLAGALLTQRWFVQHLLLDRWFLHAHEPRLQ